MRARPARLFVSHSSHATGAADRLDEIVGALTAQGFEVLYDKREITAGDEWRERINAMLWECDAATVLMTADAIASPWVLKEATILGWRHDRNPGFPLIPVALDGLMPAGPESQLWDPVPLNALQHASGTPEQIATQIANALKPLVAQLAPTPLDLLATAIATRLGAATDEFLEQVVLYLGERLPSALADDPRRLQRVIARWMLKQSPPALDGMVEALRYLGPLFDPAQVRAILHAVAPLWVPADIASWFARFGPASAECRHLAIGCEQPTMTLKHLMYVAALPQSPRPLHMLNGDPQPENIVTELAAVVWRHLAESESGSTAEQVRERLTSGETKVFAALPVPSDPTVVDDVREQLPGVTFIFYKPSPAPEPGALGAGVAAVRPLFEAGLERAVAVDYDNAIANV